MMQSIEDYKVLTMAEGCLMVKYLKMETHMKISRFGNLLLFICLATGCTFKSPAQLEFERNQWEMQQCANMGFRDGTEAFAGCRLQLRTNETQREIAKSQAQAAASQETVVIVQHDDGDHHDHDRRDQARHYDDSHAPKKEKHKDEKPTDPSPAPSSGDTQPPKIAGTLVMVPASR
jgi:hypothetical protein